MLGGVRTCMFTIAVSRLNVRLRKLVFSALIEQDIGFFDKVKTGDMLSRLSADTTTMSDLISQNLNGFLWNLVKTSIKNKFALLNMKFLYFLLNFSWNISIYFKVKLAIITYMFHRGSHRFFNWKNLWKLL